MKYISSSSELKKLISGIHLFQPPPSAIIIDDFSQIIDPLYSTSRKDPKFIDICLTLMAHLEDALSCLGCKLLVTDECRESLFASAVSSSFSSSSSSSVVVLLLEKEVQGMSLFVQHPRNRKHVHQVVPENDDDDENAVPPSRKVFNHLFFHEGQIIITA
jgi:hypothetical protein